MMARIGNAWLGTVLGLGLLSAASVILVFAFDDVREVLREAKREFRAQAFVWTTEALQCPRNAVVLLVLGQSNAANHVYAEPAGVDPSGTAFSFFRGRCYALADPVPGASGTRASV